MAEGTAKEKNMIIKLRKYIIVNISMEKEMEKEKNITVMVN